MHQLFDLARMSFDDSDRAMRTLPTIVRACAVAVAVFVLVWLLKPDLFGLVPNSLDPMFYTGYAINLDDALAAAGNRHYFVTRWTSYMPMYVFSEVFGPYWGRLVLRLVMILVLSEMFWRVGFKLAFPAKSRLLGIFVVVTAPMFVRAFTTDYPEYFIIWGSMLVCLLVVSFSFDPSLVKSIAIGILATSILIANPFSAALLVFTLLAGLVLAGRSGVGLSWMVKAPLVAVFSGAVVVLVGYLQFKHRYLIGNVYQPSLDFVRTYERPKVDGWVTPTKQWLEFFPWIYIPPMLVIGSYFVFRKETVLRKVAFTISAVSGLIYLFHVLLEIRSGHALETSFYWSMSLGPVLVLMFLLTGCLVRQLGSIWSVISAVIFLCLVYFRIPQQLEIPSGASMFVVLGVLVLCTFVTLAKFPKVGVSVFLGAFLWAQVGGPQYSIRTNGGDLNSPRYDLVYVSPANESNAILDETLWFLNQMDGVNDDWKSTFLTAGGWSAAIVGTYIPHPFSRWVVPFSPEQVLSPNVRDELEFKYRHLLVVYGDPTEVASLLTRLRPELPRSLTVLDTTNSEGLKYRLVVMMGNGSANGESTIPMARLDRAVGSAEPDGAVVVDDGTSSGFVSFGPYFGLGSGDYAATIVFESREKEDLGYFEVFNDETKEHVRTRLMSDGRGLQKSTVSFYVPPGSSTWQLRTVYSGKSEAVFRTIHLKKVAR